MNNKPKYKYGTVYGNFGCVKFPEKCVVLSSETYYDYWLDKGKTLYHIAILIEDT